MTQQEQRENISPLFRIDRFLALHQPHCWLFVAGMAVVGMLAILRFMPGQEKALTILWALMLYGLYTWMSRAPLRALSGVMNRIATPGETKEAFAFVWGLEKALPSLKRREMAFSILTAKAVLLARVGQFDDALRLLRGFDRIWDPSQKEHLESLMRQLEGVKTRARQAGKEEN